MYILKFNILDYLYFCNSISEKAQSPNASSRNMAKDAYEIIFGEFTK